MISFWSSHLIKKLFHLFSLPRKYSKESWTASCLKYPFTIFSTFSQESERWHHFRKHVFIVARAKRQHKTNFPLCIKLPLPVLNSENRSARIPIEGPSPGWLRNSSKFPSALLFALITSSFNFFAALSKTLLTKSTSRDILIWNNICFVSQSFDICLIWNLLGDCDENVTNRLGTFVVRTCFLVAYLISTLTYWTIPCINEMR